MEPRRGRHPDGGRGGERRPRRAPPTAPGPPPLQEEEEAARRCRRGQATPPPPAPEVDTPREDSGAEPGATGLSQSPILGDPGTLSWKQRVNRTLVRPMGVPAQGPALIAQMSLYERQAAVQALQALQRQPNAAQYFHQLMLQQQLSNAQLHSLAAVQQATIAASRQASSPNSSTAQQQTATTQASMNLATTSAAQLISRLQSVSSPSATTLTQSVLLGNTTSPPLNQSQAQMYLRVQNLAVRNQQASAQGPQMPGSTQKAIPPGASPVSGLSQASSQALAVAQASSGASGQSLNLSQAGGGSGNSLPGSMGPGGGGQAPGGLGQLPSSGLTGGSCPRKGTGVVQPLPAAQ